MNRVDWYKNRTLWYSLGAGFVVVVMAIVMLANRKNLPAPGQASVPFQVVGFYENASPGGSSPTSMTSFSTHWSQVSTVSPLWFSVTPTGTVVNTGFAQALVTLAHAHHRLVVPLFINAGGSTSVLWQASTRQAAARNIKAAVEKYHLDGINLDFELLNPSSRADLSKFVADLKTQLQPLKKVLAVSVFPLVGLPASVNGADDYPQLADNANYLVIMAYDHHYSGGPSGPVAPYGWVKSNVVAALKQIPANKVVLAIGMYGYDWTNNGKPGPAATVTDIAAEALAKAHGVQPRYDRGNSQNTFTYTTGGVSHVVWYMGDRSAKARVDLAESYHLAGVALWQLGDEDPRFWETMPKNG